ncbi:hypothetical protein R3P38DRAFT_324270 [Favolaschia claudopus]|uniref:Uncharacterized protein n=1 Tax=Favolaschia claudopus TaxID=2862362 RepID=A0AAW0CSF4_9AGAR
MALDIRSRRQRAVLMTLLVETSNEVRGGSRFPFSCSSSHPRFAFAHRFSGRDVSSRIERLDTSTTTPGPSTTSSPFPLSLRVLAPALGSCPACSILLPAFRVYAEKGGGEGWTWMVSWRRSREEVWRRWRSWVGYLNLEAGVLARFSPAGRTSCAKNSIRQPSPSSTPAHRTRRHIPVDVYFSCSSRRCCDLAGRSVSSFHQPTTDVRNLLRHCSYPYSISFCSRNSSFSAYHPLDGIIA